ncbi:MAG: DNA polymerase III subunit delta [Thermonemataceae bacterium]|nr:DNA polymerase III subunit delta [Thermonemataceae bacterium]
MKRLKKTKFVSQFYVFMLFEEIYGLKDIKKKLIQAVEQNHVAHAQLFAGRAGSGNLAMALAMATYIFCENKGENDACGQCAACSKMKKLVHPDLHFVLPVSSTTKVAKPLSQDFLKEWRSFALQNTYAGISEWLACIGAESKTPSISAEESRKIVSTLSLMPYESEYKILLIWLPEYLNITSANALLKALEEPPQKTLFFLVSEQPEKMLITILSRLQRIRVRDFEDEEVRLFLEEKLSIAAEKARQVAHLAEGNLQKAIYMSQEIEDDNHLLFRDWMRLCYTRNYQALIEKSEEFAKMPKEVQKNLLLYGLSMSQETLLYKYASEELLRVDAHSLEFINGFAKTMDMSKIHSLYYLLNEALQHLERNANAKIIFLDTSLLISQMIR